MKTTLVIFVTILALFIANENSEAKPAPEPAAPLALVIPFLAKAVVGGVAGGAAVAGVAARNAAKSSPRIVAKAVQNLAPKTRFGASNLKCLGCKLLKKVAKDEVQG